MTGVPPKSTETKRSELICLTADGRARPVAAAGSFAELLPATIPGDGHGRCQCQC